VPHALTVTNEKVVSIDYVLEDLDGNVLDRSAENTPLVYLHGKGAIIPGLEEELAGKAIGDQFEVRVPPEKGYGPKRKYKTQELLRSHFPADADVVKGARFVMEGPDGQAAPIWVTKVQGRSVHVSPEHPLAGMTLFFRVTVREIRDATSEELAHGHAHGPHGHHDHD
jgi:FKBP-type peptidyl-prolyl cis-trans isomerase SlyD